MDIIWTITDEAPALATRSLLPIIKAFAKKVNINILSKDISLAGRVLSSFPDYLNPEQKIEDDLKYLGELVKKSDGNIIKLPNISASIPQLKECIIELQNKGFNIPDYPEEPKTEEENKIKERYSKCLGSAVNPVIREGNSDRRAAESVKNFAKKNPHKLKPYSKDSKAHVACMSDNDFYGNEQSIIIEKDDTVTIEYQSKDGVVNVLDTFYALNQEVIDSSFISRKILADFYSDEIRNAKEKGLLFSLHLKATMMKVSDPIMFGCCVEEYFKDVFLKHKYIFEAIGVNPNLGLSDLYTKIKQLPQDTENTIKEDILLTYKKNPDLAMVDSDRGITNLHAPNDIIIDASMPVVIRDGGQMWNPSGELQECKAVIPDRCYATMYNEILEDCKLNGQFDVEMMGNVSNVGLMAQKAEEYGSHPTTFEIEEDGLIQVKNSSGNVLMEHHVEKDDIWRLSKTKDIPINNWVKLAVERAKITGNPLVFWLDAHRSHDANIIEKVNNYLPLYNKNKDIDYYILAPREAMKFTLKKIRKGENVISATGNVLRDYLTDLFPILELGTSAKMLSIVPLIAGGRLFETGAGGSAPKHVQQFTKEGHLRWDSLGEFLALAESLRFIAQRSSNKQVEVFTSALDTANSLYLDHRKSPARVVGQPGNPISHYYLIKYWAQAITEQKDDLHLANQFKSLTELLDINENIILDELMSTEGISQNIDGYFLPDDLKADSAMRSSKTLNNIINNF